MVVVTGCGKYRGDSALSWNPVEGAQLRSMGVKETGDGGMGNSGRENLGKGRKEQSSSVSKVRKNEALKAAERARAQDKGA